MVVDLTPHPTRFKYDDYRCTIKYNGISPKFYINGEKRHVSEIERVVGDVGKMEREWRDALMEYIDTTMAE